MADLLELHLLGNRTYTSVELHWPIQLLGKPLYHILLAGVGLPIDIPEDASNWRFDVNSIEMLLEFGCDALEGGTVEGSRHWQLRRDDLPLFELRVERTDVGFGTSYHQLRLGVVAGDLSVETR